VAPGRASRYPDGRSSRHGHADAQRGVSGAHRRNAVGCDPRSRRSSLPSKRRAQSTRRRSSGTCCRTSERGASVRSATSICSITRTDSAPAGLLRTPSAEHSIPSAWSCGGRFNVAGSVPTHAPASSCRPEWFALENACSTPLRSPSCSTRSLPRAIERFGLRSTLDCGLESCGPSGGSTSTSRMAACTYARLWTTARP
jgi:hypothetical protein